MHKFSENLKSSYGAFSSALGGESSDKVEPATFVDMKNYRKVYIIALASGVASDAVLTLTGLKATSNAGASSATTTYTDTFTATATSELGVLEIEMHAEQLGTGYRYAGFRLATGDGSGTEKVSVVMIQGIPRYGQASLPT